MTVNKDLNLGTVVTIAIFLVVQTGGGIWWASSIHSSVTEQGETLSKQIVASDEENLRQWSRINKIEAEVEAASASASTILALMERVERDMTALRSEQRQTNEFLRDILLNSMEAEQ